MANNPTWILIVAWKTYVSPYNQCADSAGRGQHIADLAQHRLAIKINGAHDQRMRGTAVPAEGGPR